MAIKVYSKGRCVGAFRSTADGLGAKTFWSRFVEGSAPRKGKGFKARLRSWWRRLTGHGRSESHYRGAATAEWQARAEQQPDEPEPPEDVPAGWRPGSDFDRAVQHGRFIMLTSSAELGDE